VIRRARRHAEELNRQTEEWTQASFREHLRRIGLVRDGRSDRT
jgi:hypothetical protein